MSRDGPAYQRLDVDERRRQVLDLGRDLFTRHAYDELTMAQIAREAGISKGLLYHYFPSKQAYFGETLRQAAAEVAERVRPAAADDPRAQLRAGIDAWFGWIEENRLAYTKLMRSSTSHTEVRDLVDAVRRETARLIVDGLGVAGSPRARTGAIAWLWFVDGACLDWLEHGDPSRDDLGDLLAEVLDCALRAPRA